MYRKFEGNGFLSSDSDPGSVCHIIEEGNGFLSSGSDPGSVCHILEKVLQLLREEAVLGSKKDVPVVAFKHPEELKNMLDFSLKPTSVNSEEDLWSLVKIVVKHCVKTSHPYFLNQLYGGLDPYGLAGAWISEALNTNQYTYEVAPAFTLAEISVIDRVLSLVGFENGDGIFAPGGSMANMFAITLARYQMDPDVKRKGVAHLPPLAMFTSEDSHYSMIKASHWLGIGTENVIKVPVDPRGCMKPVALATCIKQAINDGKKPFFVNATAGTTVLGAFDPIDSIADVCKQFNLWLHIDACWGGSLIFSEKYSGVLKGMHRADSYAWNPHKMLGAPLQCSIIIIKEKGLLHKCNSAAASYLFQQDKFYDTQYDTGDKSVQCGRKVDAFKLWMMWFARGDLGFRKLVDNAVDVSRYFLEEIKKKDGFKLVISEFQCSNICFWYIPNNLRNQPETEEWWKKIEEVAPKIKERMLLSGSLMISYQPLPQRNLCNFFRLVTTCHPPPTNKDMDFVIEEIEKHGENL